MSEHGWTRDNWSGFVSAFPPCAACGAPYEAHEELSELTSARGHRIGAPGMPQHGMHHYFTPMPPDTPKDEPQVGEPRVPGLTIHLPPVPASKDYALNADFVGALKAWEHAVGALAGRIG